MADDRFCRICLVFDVRMYSLNEPLLREAYLQILQISAINIQDQFVCYECGGLLHKYRQFQSKCVQSEEILNSLEMDNIKLTRDQLKLIDRKKTKLLSSMGLTSMLIVNCQELNKKDDKEEIKEEEVPTKINVKKEAIDRKKQKKCSKKELKSVIKDTYDSLDDNKSDVDVNMFSDNDKSEDSINKIYDMLINKPTKKKTEVPVKNESDAPIKTKRKKRKPKQKLDGNMEEKKDNRMFLKVEDFVEYATIIDLSPEEAKQEVLLRKESSNYTNSMYKCELCFRGFNAEKAFNNHLNKHSVEYGAYECEYCHVRTATRYNLSKHINTCHRRKFICKLCPYTCFCSFQARLHMEYHKGKTYPCDVCGKQFVMPHSLTLHKNKKHEFESENICALCGNIFSSAKGLGEHNYLMHRLDKNEYLGPNCEDCGIHFCNEQAWERHLLLSSKHKVSQHYSCDYCGESFSDKKSLKAHRRLHKTTARYKEGDFYTTCVLCNSSLSDRTDYKTHMTTKHPDSEEAKKVQENIDERVCEICGKAFLAHEFYAHKMSHKEKMSRAANHTKPHKCDNCDKWFMSKGAIMKHIKTVHLGIRPYKCTMCSRAFLNACDVRTHLTHSHNKVPWPKPNRNGKRRRLVDIMTT